MRFVFYYFTEKTSHSLSALPMTTTRFKNVSWQLNRQVRICFHTSQLTQHLLYILPRYHGHNWPPLFWMPYEQHASMPVTMPCWSPSFSQVYHYWECFSLPRANSEVQMDTCSQRKICQWLWQEDPHQLRCWRLQGSLWKWKGLHLSILWLLSCL